MSNVPFIQYPQLNNRYSISTFKYCGSNTIQKQIINVIVYNAILLMLFLDIYGIRLSLLLGKVSFFLCI